MCLQIYCDAHEDIRFTFMTLLKLDIYAVRNIQKETIIPAPKLNFIVGENASGKSAVIEAIFILGRAKSFRSATIKPVINFTQNHLIVSAQTLQSNGSSIHLGIQLDSKSFCCSIIIPLNTFRNAAGY